MVDADKMLGMTVQRWVLAGTAVVVAVLAVVFAVLGWDWADKAASVVSALAGVAALGVAVWAAWPVASGGGSVRVSHTGRATTSGAGRANTGFSGRASAVPGRVRVKRTGQASSDDGDANTGVDLT
ncbi:hypothetical protein ABT158_41325 [Nonomuraea sp. NPDC001636]|uniref:hypothetical protein n=1 Tax=Nonomuraea sp. NPDC001636 TaxID=3154391 RepID=UPI0033347CE4